MIRYYDEHGNRLNIRTELDDALDNLLNSYYDKLSQMTAKQRMNYFKYEQFVEPLRYTQDVDNTTYVVRTHFDENADKTILQRIENLVEKDLI
ncbi:MAG: transposon-encoded TnpW family protein [Clostridia bacterium]|nr:transposon-encoded TnpW family protein [Clostridia bacterium]